MVQAGRVVHHQVSEHRQDRVSKENGVVNGSMWSKRDGSYIIEFLTTGRMGQYNTCDLNGSMWSKRDGLYIIKFLTTGRTGSVQYM